MASFEQLQEWFRSSMAGNSADYAKFLEGITPHLKRIVVRKLGSNVCDDVVQEILISIHKARHTYDGERPIQPWLSAIIRFRMTDALRKHYAQNRFKTIDIADIEHVLADVTQTEGTNESIDEILDGVPDRQRTILTLMHVEGYTAKEVGTKLDMSESAVKVAAHRAVKKIRERLGNG